MKCHERNKECQAKARQCQESTGESTVEYQVSTRHCQESTSESIGE